MKVKIPLIVRKQIKTPGSMYRLILLLDNKNDYVEVESNNELEFEKKVKEWWSKHKHELHRSDFNVYLFEGGNINEIKFTKTYE